MKHREPLRRFVDVTSYQGRPFACWAGCGWSQRYSLRSFDPTRLGRFWRAIPAEEITVEFSIPSWYLSARSLATWHARQIEGCLEPLAGARGRPVEVWRYSPDGELLQKYRSLRAASAELGWGQGRGWIWHLCHTGYPDNEGCYLFAGYDMDHRCH